MNAVNLINLDQERDRRRLRQSGDPTDRGLAAWFVAAAVGLAVYGTAAYAVLWAVGR